MLLFQHSTVVLDTQLELAEAKQMGAWAGTSRGRAGSGLDQTRSALDELSQDQGLKRPPWDTVPSILSLLFSCWLHSAPRAPQPRTKRATDSSGLAAYQVSPARGQEPSGLSLIGLL